ncbi:hypothetical protein [Paraburkholderia sp. J67]|uniref:hypothetical protein n=1 Tax=Paraburkholderia sp. J67 TaxID=2805435 RepID=UPI002ABD95DE|nr:hypothetical protein [Paraburkholderia sp. J67]
MTALFAFAHAQPGFAPHGGFHGGGGGGFGRAPMMRAAASMHWGAAGGPGGHYGERPTPMRVADQGGWRERGGPGGPRGSGGPGGPGSNRQPERRETPGYSSNPYGNGFGNGYSNYRGPIQPVSAETRQVPHPPADSPVRAGSIREDVARYNEERGTFRPFPRNGGDVPRPPMPSPYRN